MITITLSAHVTVKVILYIMIEALLFIVFVMWKSVSNWGIKDKPITYIIFLLASIILFDAMEFIDYKVINWVFTK